MSSMDVDLMDRVATAVDQGKVELVDGDIETAPGVHCRLAADTHTFRSQCVEVETLSGPYVVAGDCVYWYINIERMWPPGNIQGNAWSLVHTMEKLRVLVGAQRLERIVLGHDPEIFIRHRRWLSGVNPVVEDCLAAGKRPRFHSSTS